MRIPPYFPRLGALALACALALPAQAAERAWSYSYNALGLIERADGPRTDVQDVTLYAYDSRGNLTQVTNALGQVTRLGDYDERGKPGSITDANGVTSSLAYTGVDGWLASVSTAGSTTRFDYDAVGQITRVTRGDGSWLSYEYDDARRLVAIGNNLGERLEYDVDTKGNRTAQRIKDASGSLVRQQQWAYDELGRLLRAVGAGGQTRSFAYDFNDNPVGETNPRQFAHSQAFDALDRLVGQSDPLGGKTRLAYDAQDNLTEVKDPRGVTTRYEYDGLGNLTRLVSPDSGTTTFEHDAAGNVIRRTDARGAVTEYRYDALNRLIERHSPSDPSLDVQYRYDLTADGNKGIGRLGAIEGARDSLVYRYDERGNLVEQVRSIRLDQQTLLDRVTYRYDAANQLLEIGYPSGLAIGYPRNAGGQVASVTLAVGDKAPSTLVGQIAYLPFGPLLRLTWGNGITLSREYDQDYQLLRQKVGPWQSDYQHDANGNIQQHRHSLWGTLDYQYDPLDRLTEERGVQGGRSYAYDAVGNRTQRSDNPASGGTASSQDYQYAPDSNRLTAIGAQTGLRRPGPPAKRQPRRPAGRRIPLQRPRPAHRQAHPRERHHLPLWSRRPVARRSRTRRQRPETASPVLSVAGQPAAGHHRRRLRRPGQGRQPDPALPPWRPPRHPAPGHRRQRPDRLAVAVRRLRPRRSAEPGQHPGQPALPRAVLRCGERAALQLLPRL